MNRTVAAGRNNLPQARPYRYRGGQPYRPEPGKPVPQACPDCGHDLDIDCTHPCCAWWRGDPPQEDQP